MTPEPPRCQHFRIGRLCLLCGTLLERPRPAPQPGPAPVRPVPSPLAAPAASSNWTKDTYVPPWAEPIERRKP